MFVRNALNIVSFLWYTDLGDILLHRPSTEGKPASLAKMRREVSGIQPQVSASDRPPRRITLFMLLRVEADDRVKKVIYNFLRQMQSAALDI